MSDETWFEKGFSLAILEKYTEALEAFEKEIEINPKNDTAWLFKGLSLYDLKKYVEAMLSFEKAIEINPKNDTAWYSKGTIHLNFERYVEAMLSFEQAIEINQNNDNAWNGKGLCLDNLKKYAEAMHAFEKAIEIDPKNDIALSNRGICILELKGNKKGIEAFEKAIEINPKNYRAWNNLGVVLARLERYVEAIEAYKKAIEINPKEDLPAYNLGELFLNLGNLEGATKIVKDTLQRNENLASILALQGRIDIKEKNYDVASKNFRKAISLDIGNPKHLLWEAYANFLKINFSLDLKDKKYKEGVMAIIRNLETAVPLSEKYGNEMSAYILFFLGYFYFKSGDMFTAKEKLEECIRLKSKSKIQTSASILLDNIWNHKIKPTWWRWWLNSPLYRWPKRIIFFILSLVTFAILALLFLHPFISWWFFSLQINWSLYGIFVTILIIILISPSIERLKVRDLEVILHSPPHYEPVLSPTIMEEKIREVGKNIRNRIN